MAIFEVKVTETNVGYVFAEADTAEEAAEVAEARLAEDPDWEAQVYWDEVGMECAEGLERSDDEVGGREVLLGEEGV